MLRLRFSLAGLLALAASATVAQEVVFKDPIGDDNGPGNYVYPTDPVYKPGTFDLTELRVTQTGDKVTFAISVNSDLEDPWAMPAPANFSVQMAFVHIQTGKGGFTKGLPGTNVQFAPDSAWNKVVILSPQPAGRVRSEAKQKAADLLTGIVVPDEVIGKGRTFSGTVNKKDLGDGDITKWGYQVIMQSNEGFPDKDALLETVIIGILERQDERLRMMLTPAMARQIPLAVFAEQLINNMLVSYRANAGLLRALRQFAHGRDHTSFYRKLNKLEMASYQYLVELFLVHRKEIKHPDPQMAVSFALMMLVSALIELILADHDMKNWQAVIPRDGQRLKSELLRSFLRYLGIEQKGG